ncbi:hypothetical protein C8F01DRAFT_1234466 [Mycena amicta]|nr:hypothetical protein C8F01DRAFT_1234466 [Mycena amicta]
MLTPCPCPAHPSLMLPASPPFCGQSGQLPVPSDPSSSPRPSPARSHPPGIRTTPLRSSPPAPPSTLLPQCSSERSPIASTLPDSVKPDSVHTPNSLNAAHTPISFNTSSNPQGRLTTSTSKLVPARCYFSGGTTTPLSILPFTTIHSLVVVSSTASMPLSRPGLKNHLRFSLLQALPSAFISGCCLAANLPPFHSSNFIRPLPSTHPLADQGAAGRCPVCAASRPPVATRMPVPGYLSTGLPHLLGLLGATGTHPVFLMLFPVLRDYPASVARYFRETVTFSAPSSTNSEFTEEGYSGCDVRVTHARTEIIIRATHTQEVLGERGRPVSQAHRPHHQAFQVPRKLSLELYVEKVQYGGLSSDGDVSQ